MAQLVEKEHFFELPYWSSLLIRHNLDVMHIEKNICESILGTLLNITYKSKDTEKARVDMQHFRIRKDQHHVRDKEGSTSCQDSNQTPPLAQPSHAQRKKPQDNGKPSLFNFVHVIGLYFLSDRV